MTVSGVSMCGPCYEMGHAAHDYVQNCRFFLMITAKPCSQDSDNFFCQRKKGILLNIIQTLEEIQMVAKSKMS